MNSKRISSANWEVRYLTAPLGLSQVLSKGGIGFSPGLGTLFFEFRNVDSFKSYPFVFMGLGIDLGIKATAGTGSWTKISTRKPMGDWDLDLAGGNVSFSGIGMGLGYGIMFISAWNGLPGIDNLFFGIPIRGLELGTGAGATILNGVWKKLN